MEAVWRGCALKLDAELLTLEEAGAPPVVIPLDALVGFTVVKTGGDNGREGAARASTPDGALVVRWRERGALRWARLPVPSEALQVHLFVTRLSQLRPAADLRGLPEQEALRRLGAGGRPRWRSAFLGVVVALMLAAVAVLLLRT